MSHYSKKSVRNHLKEIRHSCLYTAKKFTKHMEPPNAYIFAQLHEMAMCAENLLKIFKTIRPWNCKKSKFHHKKL